MQPVPSISILRTNAVYFVLWLPALVLSAITTIAAVLTFPSAPMASAIAFVLAFPAVLVGIKSFKASALVLIGLLTWDVITTSWPHISFTGFFSSLVDVFLLVTAILAVLVNRLSSFESLADFISYLRFR